MVRSQKWGKVFIFLFIYPANIVWGLGSSLDIWWFNIPQINTDPAMIRGLEDYRSDSRGPFVGED